MRLASLFSRRLALPAAAVCFISGAAAHAGTIEFVKNGNFSQVTYPTTSYSAQQDYVFSNGASQHVANWTNNNSASTGKPGYNFVWMGSSTTDCNGAYGTGYGDSGSLSLWGIQNGVGNGIGPSPAGGNFMAMDGVYHPSSISQILTGLTVGMNTQVSFWYAGAQQYGFNGPTTEGFDVSLFDGTKTQTQSTAMLQNSNHGFTGWNYVTMNFTATNATETLSFLAKGTPNGEPPFSLLDGVSAVQTSVTPEPSSFLLLGTGVLSAAGFVRRRFVKA